MAGIDKILEKEIIDLKGEIDKLTLDFGADDLTPELRDLRHRVFNAHTEIEIALEVIIVLHLFDTAEPKDKSASIASFLRKTYEIIGTLGFVKKLNIVKKLLDPDSKYSGRFKDIQELNNIRVDFAHPKTKTYKKYEKREEYKNALKTISGSIKAARGLPMTQIEGVGK